MQAFFNLRRITPVWWELDLIQRLDRASIASQSKKQEEPKESGPKLPPGKPHLRKKRKPQ